MTDWIVKHDFSRWDLTRGIWVNDHVAEYEYFVDKWGFPIKPTGRSRIVPM